MIVVITWRLSRFGLLAGVAPRRRGDGEFFTLGRGDRLSDMMSMSGVTCEVVFPGGV